MQARLTLKIQFEKDIRRLTVVPQLTWQSLETLLKSVFKTITDNQWKRISVRYTDDEGDLCTVSSEAELQEAISLCTTLNSRRPILKLILSEDKPAEQPERVFGGIQVLLRTLLGSDAAEISSLVEQFKQAQAQAARPAQPPCSGWGGFAKERLVKVRELEKQASNSWTLKLMSLHARSS